MPRSDPARRRAYHREYMRRRRHEAVEATATAWCVLCGAPAKNQHGAYVHEGHVHKAAS